MLIFLLQACQTEESYYYPEKKDIVNAVYTSVTINPADEYRVYSPVNGIINQLNIEEGDQIKKGALIAVIKDENSRYSIQNAAIQKEQAVANLKGQYDQLNEIEAEIIITQNKLSNDSSLYHRQLRLWEQGVGSRNEMEQRKLAFDNSRLSLKALNNRYNRTKELLQYQLEQSEVNLSAARSVNSDYRILCQMSGTVYTLNKEVGESVTIQEPIAIIGSTDSYLIDMVVDEEDIVKLSINQHVVVSLDAFAERSFEAQITKINPQMDSRTQSFSVEATFLDPPAPLYPGLTGEASIILSTERDVLVIPHDYINEQQQVLTDTGYVKVETGTTTIEYVEILSGITSSTPLKAIVE